MFRDKMTKQEVFFKDDGEKILFRSKPEEGFWQKEIGSSTEEKISKAESKVLTDAILSGDEITKEEYYA